MINNQYLQTSTENEPAMRASRGAGPLRLRRENKALKRSEMGWARSSNRSQRNFTISGEDSKVVAVVAAASSFSEPIELEM